MAEFTFGEVDAVLATMNEIAPHKRVAFTGRIKFLLKNGLPTGERPGRGRAASYSFTDLMQLAIAIELMQAGVDQRRAARLVEHNWSSMRYPLYLGTYGEDEAASLAHERGIDPVTTRWVLIVHLNELKTLTAEGVGEYDDYEAVNAVGVDQLAALVVNPFYTSARRRTLVIDASNVTRHACFLIAFQFKFATIDSMRGDLVGEMTREREMMDKFSEEMKKRKPLDPTKQAKIAASVRRLNETDYSTTPPTPPEALEARAREMLPRLSTEAHRTLLAMADARNADGTTSITIDDTARDALKELVDFEVLIASEDDELAVSIFGRAAMRVIGEV